MLEKSWGKGAWKFDSLGLDLQDSVCELLWVLHSQPKSKEAVNVGLIFGGAARNWEFSKEPEDDAAGSGLCGFIFVNFPSCQICLKDHCAYLPKHRVLTAKKDHTEQVKFLATTKRRNKMYSSRGKQHLMLYGCNHISALNLGSWVPGPEFGVKMSLKFLLSPFEQFVLNPFKLPLKKRKMFYRAFFGAKECPEKVIISNGNTGENRAICFAVLVLDPDQISNPSWHGTRKSVPLPWLSWDPFHPRPCQ